MAKQTERWSVRCAGVFLIALVGTAAACSSGVLGAQNGKAPPVSDVGCPLSNDTPCPDFGGAGTLVDTDFYPPGPYGTKHRTSPDSEGRGERIRNDKFVGYPPGADELKPVSLSDYYDPAAEEHDALVIVAVGRWRTGGTKPLDAARASSKRIATLAVVGEGLTPGMPAEQEDLDSVRADASSWTTTVLDPGFTRLGEFFDAAALPATILIDTRSMEIVAVRTGDSMTTAEVDETVSAIASGPSLY